MIELKPRGNPGSDQDADGVRIVPGDSGGRRTTLLYLVLGVLLAAGCVGYILIPRDGTSSSRPDDPRSGHGSAAKPEANAQSATAPSAGMAAASAGNAPQGVAVAAAASTRPLTPRRAATHRAAQKPEDDPDAILPPGSPDVSAADYIQALHDQGIYDGIGAFNPPGTKPNLEGLAVPPDFELPEGYVRHFQTTDDGQAVEPILMYSPDFEFFDENGNPVAIPENRVVPPEHAPAGFPIRKIDIPPPRQPGDLSR